MRGINEREEASKLDYQVISYSKHFNHSISCLPYMTSRITENRMLPLNAFKRDPLRPHKSWKKSTRNTVQHSTHADVMIRTGHTLTLPEMGFVRRTLQQ
jgi:plasmid rolling circle replication initiator protein Rep